MKEAAITKAFVKMMAALVTMVGKHPMIVQVRFQFNGGYTGCTSLKLTYFQIKILNEPLLVPKQMIPQNKALILSFHMTPKKI